MVDDALGISVCGFQTNRMAEFLNVRTNIMNLQVGCQKCDKLHIGKRQNDDACPTLTIDTWEEEVSEEEGSIKRMKDVFKGKEAMNDVFEKKYLGDLITKNGTNHNNIKE